MKLYKLTTQDGYTRKGEYNECLWGEGVTHEGTGKGVLCGPGWIHAYEHPLLAVLLNPIHANIRDPILWECEGEIVKRDGQLKVGCRSLTTVRRAPLPPVSVEFRVRFAIKCALMVCGAPTFVEWAVGWLSGKDRSTKAAFAAYGTAAYADAYAAAARAATDAATYAADASAADFKLSDIAEETAREIAQTEMG